MFLAATTSPVLKFLIIDLISEPNKCDATEITPCAPTDIIGNVKLSSPEYITKSSGQSLFISVILSISEKLCLLPIIFPNSLAKKATVLGSIKTPVLEGILYNMIGKLVDLAIVEKCSIIPL